MSGGQDLGLKGEQTPSIVPVNLLLSRTLSAPVLLFISSYLEVYRSHDFLIITFVKRDVLWKLTCQNLSEAELSFESRIERTLEKLILKVQILKVANMRLNFFL